MIINFEHILLRNLICFVVIILLINTNEATSNQKQLNAKQKELEQIRKEIEQTKRRIGNLSNREKSETRLINQYKKNLAQLNNRLFSTQQSIIKMQDSINQLTLNLTNEEKKLNRLKIAYSLLCSQNYANEFNNNNKKYILTNEVNPVYKLYLQWFERHTSKKVTQINKCIDSTEQLIHRLGEIRVKQESMKKAHEIEKSKIHRLTRQKSIELRKIKADKNKLVKQLRDKERSAQKLRSIIAELIKKQKEDDKKSIASPRSTQSIGTLRWPTVSKRILRSYGQSTDAATNLSFDNPGIDIATPSGSTVVASAVGTVKKIYWLPGYGSLVIIDHGNNLRTVYANLLRITVKEGDKISAGGLIGYSGESLDGECLHFQVWKGNQKMNPLNYIR